MLLPGAFHARRAVTNACLACSQLHRVCVQTTNYEKNSRLSYESANERVIDFCFFIKCLSVGSSEHTIRIW